MLASVAITVLYFIPVFYICYQAYLVAHKTYYKEADTDEEDMWKEFMRKNLGLQLKKD